MKLTMGKCTVEIQAYSGIVFLFINIEDYLPMTYVQISQCPRNYAGVYLIRQYTHLHHSTWSI